MQIYPEGEKTPIRGEILAPSAAHLQRAGCDTLPNIADDSDALAEVIGAWGDLPEAIRAGILAMVRSSTRPS
jgi:hypothetical protein